MDITRKDKIQNDYIKEKVDVRPIEEKMPVTQLQWFGHVQEKPL